ncbi:putative Beta-amylase 2; chloroplastic [Paratrimastix pyriformis]|uniref:Beta-amylase n=1 Tax=Paratrimastix pyriformis TaxID=342808 RepID=A0ABQ8UFY0_9EUKA|nr:putative Beta-amylase 2; chloroplastic [Paratrimastix pyriformis]
MRSFLAFIALLAISSAIPVNVMMPLNTIQTDGSLNPNINLQDKLQKLKSGGVNGVMLDVWWGIVERNGPRQYDFSGYTMFADMCSKIGLKVQVVMSFHQCGGNVGDDCNIPIPGWVRNVGSDIFYRDREGHNDVEYLSLSMDHQQRWSGRTALDMYHDMMAAFRQAMGSRMGSVVTEVQVGLGPCGELRYPGYQLDRWSFPGVGEFQCYDPTMLNMLESAANNSGHAEWGHGGPGDAGSYNSKPGDTGFFRSGGSWSTPYGDFFLSWYSDALVQHASDVLAQAKSAFQGTGVKLAGKVAGIHWWFLSESHAAELTAGYYNTRSRSGYNKIVKAFKEAGAIIDFTCFEMRDTEQPSSAQCGPYELVGQTLWEAKNVGIGYAAENALPRYDDTAYATILDNSVRQMKIDAFTYLRLTDDLIYNGDNWSRFANFVGKMAAQ